MFETAHHEEPKFAYKWMQSSCRARMELTVSSWLREFGPDCLKYQDLKSRGCRTRQKIVQKGLVRLVKIPKIEMIGENFFGQNQRTMTFLFFFLLCVMATKAPLVQYHFYNGWVFRVAGSMQVAENSDFWSGEATQYSNLTNGKLFGFIDWMCSRFYMFSVTLFCWGSPLFTRAFVVSVYGTLYTWGSMFCMVCTCRFRCMVASLCFTRYVSVGLMWRHGHDMQLTAALLKQTCGRCWLFL